MRRLLLLAVAAVSIAAGTTPTVDTLTVETSRHRYVDGTEVARFAVAGSCDGGGPDVTVIACDQDGVQGRVRSALVGFDARHDVEMLPADAPLVSTPRRDVGEQTSRVRVRLERPGRLRVRVAATGNEMVGARPVPGSDRPDAEVSTTAAEWVIPAAEPGSYDFTVRFRLEPEDEAAGWTYLPQVTVDLLDESATAVRGLSTNIPTGRPLKSQVTMTEHVAPPVGQPNMDVSAPSRRYAAAPTSVVWATEGRLDAVGDHDSDTHGAESAYRDVPVAAVASPHPRAALTTWGVTTASRTDGKADVEASLPGGFGGDGNWRLRLTTTTDGTPAGLVDRDSIQAAFVGRFAQLGDVPDRAPAGSKGTLELRGAKDWVTAWATTLASVSPFTEATFSADLMAATSALVVARDGDLDTRDGSTVEADPIVYRAPAGHDITVVVASTTTSGPMALSTAAEFDRDESPLGPAGAASSVTVTPVMQPDGYWLESSVRDGLPISAGLVEVTVFSTAAADPATVLTEMFSVPPSSTRWVSAHHVTTGTSLRRSVGPGVYRLTVDPSGTALEQLRTLQ